ncbi:MAG: hypothetical protein ACTSUK_05110, partial [Promethearchaeota archaeon]
MSLEISKKGKVLNNFVTELLKITNVSQPHSEYEFTNPRDGWIFFSSTVNVVNSGKVRLILDSESQDDAVIVHESDKERTLEAMRFLTAGEHKVRIRCEDGLLLDSLAVRTIPEIIYCQFGNPSVSEYGPYDWNFLEKYIINNVNVMVVGASSNPTSHTKPWKLEGKKWIGHSSVPGWMGPRQTPEYCYEFWTGFFTKSLFLDGIIVNEFSPMVNPEKYLDWAEAIKKIYANKKFRSKKIYAWTHNALQARLLFAPMREFEELWEAQYSSSFLKTLMDYGHRIAWERYFLEEDTEAKARESLEFGLKQKMLEFRKALPGVERNMIINLGLFSTPGLSQNNNPSVNFKVYMDMQLNMVANDPAFSGILGVNWWTSTLADEETVRWVYNKLVRHYCIEGNTEMLSKDPYMLFHIENPDFIEGTKGWTIKPAEEGSIDVKNHDLYGEFTGRWLRYRYPKTDEGNYFLWMKRCNGKPNIFSQEIRNLQPGRLYSLKMFTADYGDLMERKSSD